MRLGGHFGFPQKLTRQFMAAGQGFQYQLIGVRIPRDINRPLRM
jgi:hypothetical protein